MNAHWSTGFLVGTVLLSTFFVLSLAGVIVGARCWRRRRKAGGSFTSYENNTDGPGLVTALSAVVLIGVLAGGLAGFYPYDAQYHQYRTFSGIVAAHNTRFLSSGDGGTDQKFVIQFRGDDTAFYGCTDTRCALAKPGDRLSLACIRTHQFSAGVDGWDCKFGSLRNPQ